MHVQSCHYDNTTDTVVLLTTKQPEHCIYGYNGVQNCTTVFFACDILLLPGPQHLTSSCLCPLDCWDSLSESGVRTSVVISTVCFGADVFFWPPLCPMMRTLSLIVVKWYQEAGTAACRLPVSEQLPISHQSVAEDFRANVMMKLVQRLISDW